MQGRKLVSFTVVLVGSGLLAATNANVEAANSSVTVEDTYVPWYVDTLVNGHNYTGLTITIGGTSEYAASGYQTVEGIGSGSTVNMNLDYYTLTLSTGDTLHFGADTTNEIVSGSSDVVTEGASADANIKGSGNTIDLSSKDNVDANGTGDHVNASGSGDVIDLQANEKVTISGSGEDVVGTTGDTIDVTGTSDHIYADLSTIEISGSDSGDIVYGAGDTGDTSDWGGYVYDPGGYGGYGGGGHYAAVARRKRGGAGASTIASGSSMGKASGGVDIESLAASDGAREAGVGGATAYASAHQLINAMSAWPHGAAGATSDSPRAPQHFGLEHLLAEPHLRASRPGIMAA